MPMDNAHSIFTLWKGSGWLKTFSGDVLSGTGFESTRYKYLLQLFPPPLPNKDSHNQEISLCPTLHTLRLGLMLLQAGR